MVFWESTMNYFVTKASNDCGMKRELLGCWPGAALMGCPSSPQPHRCSAQVLRASAFDHFPVQAVFIQPTL
jgi:hypothetical protein